MLCKMIAGFGMFEYGCHCLDLEVLGVGWRWAIGMAIWIVYYLLLDVAEALK